MPLHAPGSAAAEVSVMAAEQKNAELRKKVDEVGLEEARKGCTPIRSTKAKPKTPVKKVGKKKQRKKKLSGAQRRQAANKNYS